MTEDLPDKRNEQEEMERADEERQRTLALRAALKHLDKMHRKTILLRYEEGLTIEEIAERLNIPLGTVKRRLHTGRERIRKVLTPYLKKD